MKIILSVPYLAANDGIGNDVIISREAFRELGYETEIFAPLFDDKLKSEVISESLFTECLKNENYFWIHHHGVFWEPYSKYLNMARCKTLLRYHNVTPAEFFDAFDPTSAFATRLGRKQTLNMVQSKRIDHFIPASPFNSSELEEMGVHARSISIIAPFSRLSDFDRCQIDDEWMDQSFPKPTRNILMVGRITPNKGHRQLIETISQFEKLHKTPVRLIIAGRITENLANYHEYLQKFRNSLNIKSEIFFTDSISFDRLYTLYKKSDLFLCLSEHEGFCLPIIEAQYLGLPVLTIRRCALGDTVGDGQILADFFDGEFYANQTEQILHDSELSAELVRNGHENVRRYHQNQLAQQYQQMLETIDLNLGN